MFEPQKKHELMLSDPAVNMSRYFDADFDNITPIRQNRAQAHFARMAMGTALEFVLVGGDETHARKLLALAADFAGEWVKLSPATPERSSSDQWLFDAASANQVMCVNSWLAHCEYPAAIADACARASAARLAHCVGPRTKVAPSAEVLGAMWGVASVGRLDWIPELARIGGRELTGVALALTQISADADALGDASHPATKVIRRELGRRIRQFATTDWGLSQIFEGLRIVEWRMGKAGLTPRETLLRLYSYIPSVPPPRSLVDEIEALSARVGR